MSEINLEEAKYRHRAQDIETARRVWQTELPSFEIPSNRQFWLWLMLHDFDLQTVLWGIGQTARRHAKSPLVFDHALRYCSAAQNRYRKPVVRPSLPDSKYFTLAEAAH